LVGYARSGRREGKGARLNTEISVGPINVKYMGESQTEAVTMSGGDPIPATQHLAFITGPDGIALETAYLIFANGERDVRVLETGDTPSPYSRLGHGGRLGVYSLGEQHYCEARAMKLGEEAWSNLQRATYSEIESWLGSNVNDFLSSIGGSELLTRERLFGDDGRRRNELACSFDSDNFMTPFGIFALTRPLPLLKGAKK
jgi:hypothetical protein